MPKIKFNSPSTIDKVDFHVYSSPPSRRTKYERPKLVARVLALGGDQVIGILFDDIAQGAPHKFAQAFNVARGWSGFTVLTDSLDGYGKVHIQFDLPQEHCSSGPGGVPPLYTQYNHPDLFSERGTGPSILKFIEPKKRRPATRK